MGKEGNKCDLCGYRMSFVLVRVCLSQESDSKISLYFSEAKMGSLSLKLSEESGNTVTGIGHSWFIHFETGKGDLCTFSKHKGISTYFNM